MKTKTRKALKSLLADVAKHEREDGGEDVTVDLADLKRLLRWAQNEDHVWLDGDRVRTTGVLTPYTWLDDVDGYPEGTVVGDSGGDGTAMVRWDNDPEKMERKMFHNEIRLAKS